MKIIPILLSLFLDNALTSNVAFDVDHAQRRFLKHGDPNSPIFEEKNWILHTPLLFHKMTEPSAKIFIARLLKKDKNGRGLEWENERMAEYIFRHLKPDDVAVIEKEGVCQYLALGMDLNPHPFIRANPLCASEIASVTSQFERIRHALPAKLITTYPEMALILEKGIFDLDHSSLQLVLEDIHICKNISAKYLDYLTDKKTARLMTPECFTRLKDLSSTDINNISLFRSDILSELSQPLTLKTTGLLSKENLQVLSQKQKNPCFYLELTSVDAKAASGITSTCLYSYLKSGKGNPSSVTFASLWKSFNQTALDYTLEKNPELLRVIASADYSNIPSLFIDRIFSDRSSCAHIPSDAKLNIGKRTRISSRSFAALSPKLQPQVLVQIESPPKDLLSRVSSDMLTEWILSTDKNGLVRGFQVISYAKHSANLIKYLSTKAKKHACASIKSGSELIADKFFASNMTVECVKNLSFKPQDYECKKIPRLWMIKNLKKIVKDGKVEDQKNMVPRLEKNDLLLLMDEKHFCHNLRYEFFKLLPSGLKKLINQDCFREFTFKSRLTAIDLQLLSPKIFEHLSVEEAKGLKLENIPEDKLTLISKHVEMEDSVLKMLDEGEGFKKWDAKKVAALEPEQWPEIPASAFDTLTSQHVKQIPKASVKFWSRDQVENMSDSAMKSLSSSQLMALGEEVDDSAIKAVNKDLFPEGSEQYRIIEERTAWSPRTKWIIAIFVIILTLFAAIAIYYFFIVKSL